MAMSLNAKVGPFDKASKLTCAPGAALVLRGFKGTISLVPKAASV